MGIYSYQLELYAWNDNQVAPQLSSGGPTENDPSYNLTTEGDAQKSLGLTLLASDYTDATWETASLGTIDVGTGYDNYIWRIGVIGATVGDLFAFDNLSVTSSADLGGIKITGLSFSPSGGFVINFTSGLGNVDVYRSTDLQNWGTPIQTNIAPATFEDTTNGGLDKAFYVLVPTGNPFP